MGRLERELIKGTVLPSEVVPGTSQRAAISGISGAPGRRHIRRVLQRGSPVESLLKLRRLRKLRALLFEVHKKYPVFVVSLPATKQIRVTGNPKEIRTPLDQLGEFPEKSVTMCNVRNTRRSAEIYFPDSDEPFLKYINKDALAKAALKLVSLQHELGEAVEYMHKKIIPFSTHNGPEPLIREKLYSMGDPGLQAEVCTWRTGKDDQLFEKLYKQVGGTPDRPVPLNGKAHRALERLLVRNVDKISTIARADALDRAAGCSVGDRGKYHIPYIPKQAIKDFRVISDDLLKIYTLRAPTPRHKHGRRPRHLSSSELKRYNAAKNRIYKKITPAILEACGANSASHLLKILIAL